MKKMENPLHVNFFTIIATASLNIGKLAKRDWFMSKLTSRHPSTREQYIIMWRHKDLFIHAHR